MRHLHETLSCSVASPPNRAITRNSETRNVCTRSMFFLYEGTEHKALLPHRADNDAITRLIGRAQTHPNEEGATILGFHDRTREVMLAPVHRGDSVTWVADKDLFILTTPKQLPPVRLFGEAVGLTDSTLVELLSAWRATSAQGILCCGPGGTPMIANLRGIDSIRFA